MPPDALALLAGLAQESMPKEKKEKKKAKKSLSKSATSVKASKKAKKGKKEEEDEYIDDETIARHLLSPKVAVVIGNESTGVSQELLGVTAVSISIPTRVAALNVSVAAGVLLNHLFGQRDAAERRQRALEEVA